jgi:hypothetical protein
LKINQELTPKEVEDNNSGSLLLGTSLAVAALISVSALAMRFGLEQS